MKAIRFVSTIAAAVLMPLLAHAQSASGTIVIFIAGPAAEGDSRFQAILTTADANGRQIRADSGSKSIRFSALPAGRYRLETRAIGFAPDTSFVEVRNGSDANVTVTLHRTVADLAPVTVAGVGHGHLNAFEKRRGAGKGTFLTRDDITKSRRSQVVELLRTVRGLRVDCANGCKVQMVRSTICEPRYFINGFPSDAGILLTPLLDVAGIEIYRGPSETPPEFMGAQSMCGAVGIWTK